VACMEWALQRRPVDWPALISALETLQAEDAWKRAHDGVDAHLDALRAATQADRKVCRLVVALCGRVGLKMRGDELARLDLPGLVQEPTEEMVNDPKLAARVRVVLARAIALDAGKPITAAAEAMQAAVGSDAGQRSRLADVLVRDAGLLYGTKDHERAERLYDLSLRFADPKSPRRAAIESTRLKFLTDTGKAQAARQAAERLAAPDRRVPSKIRKEALLTLAKLSVDADDVGEAARWARDADRQLAGDRATLAEFHLDYAKALSGRERWPDAAAECQKLVAVFPGQTRACFEAQALAVRCLMQHRQYGDALAAAKVLYDVAPNSEKEITEAVNLVMQALKGKYRSIALANDFVAFQSHGPDGEDGKKGTEDDVEDPLVKVQWTPPPEIEALFKKTVAGLPQDFQGRRWRGYLYLYWGKPELALKEFAWRYDHAPLEQKAIDEAIDDLVVALKACCGHALAGERFLDYQKYGPKGRDGKAGTADDLTDPLKEILGKR